MQAAGKYQAYLRSGDAARDCALSRAGSDRAVLGYPHCQNAVLRIRHGFSHDALAKDHSKPLWARKHFVLPLVAQFLYVGAQVSAWSYMIPYVISGTGIVSARRAIGSREPWWHSRRVGSFLHGCCNCLRSEPARIYSVLNAAICGVPC